MILIAIIGGAWGVKGKVKKTVITLKRRKKMMACRVSSVGKSIQSELNQDFFFLFRTTFISIEVGKLAAALRSKNGEQESRLSLLWLTNWFWIWSSSWNTNTVKKIWLLKRYNVSLVLKVTKIKYIISKKVAHVQKITHQQNCNRYFKSIPVGSSMTS